MYTALHCNVALSPQLFLNLVIGKFHHWTDRLAPDKSAPRWSARWSS